MKIQFDNFDTNKYHAESNSFDKKKRLIVHLIKRIIISKNHT